jgi:hypothetical protein
VVFVTLRYWAVPWTALGAAAPGVLAALSIASRPPAPTELRRLGWMLIIASAVTASVLVFALRTA